MGDNLNTEVWRCVRAGGSLRGELVADVNQARAAGVPLWDREVILDAVDELIESGDLRDDPARRLHRVLDLSKRPPGNVYVIEDEEAARQLGMTPIEYRLDNAWPRAGGRREIVRALADEVQEAYDLLAETRAALLEFDDRSTGHWLDPKLIERIDNVIGGSNVRDT